MKIAILVPNFVEFDGSARVAEVQAEELAREGNDVAVFTFAAGIRPENVEVFVMGMPRSLFLERVYRLLFPLDLFKALKWLPRLKGFDEIIVHLYPLTWLAWLAKKRYGAKYTFWYHGIMDPQFFPRLYERVYIRLQILMTRLTVSNADRAVGVSRAGVNELKRYTGLDGEVVYNKVDLGKFHPGVDGTKVREEYRLGEAPVVLFVGALRPVKGVHLLVESFNIVKQRIPDARLVVVGQADYPYYYERVKHIGDDAVVFAGFVSHESLPFYYAACDVYASCSRWEAHNLPVLEAQACGKPVVTFDIESFREEVGDAGTLVEVGNVQQFAEACVERLNQERS